MAKVLVTGGAGFIGSNLVEQLVADRHDVVVVDNLSTGLEENINPNCTFYQVDIGNDHLGDVFAKHRPEIVYHLAAQVDVNSSIVNPISDARINIVGTINLLNNCVKHRVGKIIYASSAAVYGVPRYLPIDENHHIEPISNYGVSKHTAEQYILSFHHNYGLDYTVLRYANVYGPRQGLKGEGGVVYLFAKQFLSGNEPVIFGDGKQTRDFVFVQDVVDANIRVMENGNNTVINVGSGQEISINELLDEFYRVTGMNVTPQHKGARPGDIQNSVFDIGLAERVLGWYPRVSFDSGLRRTVDFYRQIMTKQSERD